MRRKELAVTLSVLLSAASVFSGCGQAAGTAATEAAATTTAATTTAATTTAAATAAEGGEISETLDNPYTENYGSGYGTYVIGDAVETFAGAEINVGTYATIFTGGSAVYSDLKKGQTYELKNSKGEITAAYTASADKATEIHSDTFGFMAHQSSNDIQIENGTSVDSGYATFLVKTGAKNQTLNASVDDAKITNGGVLIQVMDNDDTTNGGMMSADDAAEAAAFAEKYQNTRFTINEYWSIGQVANLVNDNGANKIEITLEDGAVWNVTATSLIASLTITGDSKVIVPEGVTLTVGGTEYTDCELTADSL